MLSLNFIGVFFFLTTVMNSRWLTPWSLVYLWVNSVQHNDIIFDLIHDTVETTAESVLGYSLLHNSRFNSHYNPQSFSPAELKQQVNVLYFTQ
jgi:hypothetical protein